MNRAHFPAMGDHSKRCSHRRGRLAFTVTGKYDNQSFFIHVFRRTPYAVHLSPFSTARYKNHRLCRT